MRVLVTGHRGYVGGALVPLLLEKQHEVLGVDVDLFRDCVFEGELTPVEELLLDVREVEQEHLEGCDAVLHLAGLCNDPLGDIDPDLTLDINYRATVRLAELAQAAGVGRFVFASSCSVYGAGGEEWLHEDSELRPMTPYARSKMLCEQDLVKLSNERFCPVFLRAATAYGVSPKLRFDLVLNNLVAWALSTGAVKLKSNGSPWRPLVHVEDLARAFVAALEAPAEVVQCRAFNVGQTTENFRVKDLAYQVEASLPGSVVTLSNTAGPDLRCYRVNCDRIQNELPEFTPIWTVESGIRQLFEVLQSHSPASVDFEGATYDRKAHLLRLIERGHLDSSLRRNSSAP